MYAVIWKPNDISDFPKQIGTYCPHNIVCKFFPIIFFSTHVCREDQHITSVMVNMASAKESLKTRNAALSLLPVFMLHLCVLLLSTKSPGSPNISYRGARKDFRTT